MGKKKQEAAEAEAYTVTLHYSASYTAGGQKFYRGVPRTVSASVADSLPRAFFSIVPISPEPAADPANEGK